MIKKYFSALCLLLASTFSFADLSAVNFKKVSYYKKIQADITYIQEHMDMYEGFYMDWPFTETREVAASHLENIRKAGKGKSKNFDENVLMGKISQYFFNVNNTEFSAGVSYFKKAVSLQPNNYHPYWWLAAHYGGSAHLQDSAMYYFLEAEKKEPNIKDETFWSSYAYSAYSSNALSHFRYALDKYKSVSGKTYTLDSLLWPVAESRMLKADADSAYSRYNFWNRSLVGSQVTFESCALGFKFSCDTLYYPGPGDYSNRGCGVFFYPPRGTGKEGKKIGYSILVLIHVADEGETLDTYVQRMTGQFTDKKTATHYTALTPQVAYEIKAPEMYKGNGGGHMLFYGYERKTPDYPGLVIETPMGLPGFNTNGEPFTGYNLPPRVSRLGDRIFYMIILDTCEDIYKESLEHFKKISGSFIME